MKLQENLIIAFKYKNCFADIERNTFVERVDLAENENIINALTENAIHIFGQRVKVFRVTDSGLRNAGLTGKHQQYFIRLSDGSGRQFIICSISLYFCDSGYGFFSYNFKTVPNGIEAEYLTEFMNKLTDVKRSNQFYHEEREERAENEIKEKEKGEILLRPDGNVIYTRDHKVILKHPVKHGFKKTSENILKLCKIDFEFTQDMSSRVFSISHFIYDSDNSDEIGVVTDMMKNQICKKFYEGSTWICSKNMMRVLVDGSCENEFPKTQLPVRIRDYYVPGMIFYLNTGLLFEDIRNTYDSAKRKVVHDDYDGLELQQLNDEVYPLVVNQQIFPLYNEGNEHGYSHINCLLKDGFAEEVWKLSEHRENLIKDMKQLLDEHYRAYFISYRRKGGFYCARLVTEILRNKGEKVFFDKHDISGGDFEEYIQRNILRCKYFLPIISKGSLERCNDPDDMVYKEIKLALEHGKIIVPIVMDLKTYPKNLESKITNKEIFEDLKRVMQMQTIFVNAENFDEQVPAMIERYISNYKR